MVTWLSPLNPWATQNDTLARLHEGTGDWLLNAPEFTQWLDDKTLLHLLKMLIRYTNLRFYSLSNLDGGYRKKLSLAREIFVALRYSNI